MSTVPTNSPNVTDCPLCGGPLRHDSRLLFMSASAVDPERVCGRCHLAMSPMESAARRALGMPLGTAETAAAS
jgi:hypothetical protein